MTNPAKSGLAPNPDRATLRKIGNAVRERLARDPSLYKFPTEAAELYAVADFLSADECARMIELIDAVARPSEVFEEVYQHLYRTSYSGDVDRRDSVVRTVERRICDLLGMNPEWGESVQGQRYWPGQEFKQHCDWFDTRAGYWKDEVNRGGQRSWTVMAFLNDVEQGGETEFPNLGIAITPQRGALLLWNNALRDGEPNEDTLHAALPVKRGVKYIVTKWFRTRRWT